ncbi:inositol hexakisphosphate and diphosphoinositol-pentakisphosphate kinase 2 [Plakobranchus ocellatus]|uniref:Inositol hexakisphosphate and diphosphoinositol-pentakisphosphate kinase 2 n=1 Tax=Plakobranchus ocellatus TaxID=259542 RepID=A0AAV3YSK6_9GAST|nr:inositol hexakisphosphate and diphosphoinositol-pentakisphosphate kinase 2 [Plakobranchus ocellatus]
MCKSLRPEISANQFGFMREERTRNAIFTLSMLMKRTGTYKPYKKPNTNINYINKESNHPPLIKRNLAKVIAIRLLNNSSNAEIFHQAAEKYQEALTCSGYKQQLRYTPSHQTPPHASAPRASMNLKNNSQSGATTNTINYQETPNTSKVYLRRNNARARRITWFNPPYFMNVATNIGKKFLTLINTRFPKTNILHKVINRNTIKISYSCMPNVKSIITAHNKSVLAQKKTPEQKAPHNATAETEKPVLWRTTVSRIP